MSSSPKDLPVRSSAFRKWTARVLITLVIFIVALMFALMTKEFIWGSSHAQKLGSEGSRGNH